MSFTRGISFPDLRSLLALILAFSPPLATSYNVETLAGELGGRQHSQGQQT